MKKRLQLLALSALCVLFVRAQYVAPSEGVFRIVNLEYGNAMMEDFVRKTVHGAEIGGAEDYDQMWILKKAGTGYTLQNVFTGNYIQTGNNVNNVAYWTGSEADVFNIVVNRSWSDVSYNIWDPGLGSAGLHYSPDQSAVVRWWHENHKKASEWRFVSVSITDEQIAKAKEEFERLTGGDKIDDYQAVLAEVFEDPACTVLSSTYAAMDTAAIRAALKDQLPATLVEMAVKVKAGDWAEDNEKADKPGWNSKYAKQFRVQMIEPHSIAGEITTWIGHNAHTNMDNPIGVYANKRDVLYIMVEGEIKEGAELYACWINGHSKMPSYNNGYSNGVPLKSGLNIVPFGSDGSALYINYLVHTLDIERDENGNVKYDQNGAPVCHFAHKLSEFDDLKIHIEGGYINGYYNRMGDELYEADSDSSWEYYEERANLANITILGQYEVLQFELNDVVHTETNDKGETSTWEHRGLAALFPDELPASLPANQRINAIVEAWDRIFLSEKMTLGVASRAEVDSMNKLYPRWDGKWENKAEIYDYDDALYAFCDGIKEREGDYGEYYNHRGVAYGTRSGYMYGSGDHSGYHINTTPDILTKIATEAGPTWGPAHEIGHQHQGLYTLNGEMEVTNNTFANVAVWYMGMGTSRINATDGNLAHVYDNFKNGGFLLQNNIWALTHRYYRLWLYYHRVGNNTQFFPRLFELIRQRPMERSYSSGSEMRPNDEGEMEKVSFQLTNGYKSYLHFYQLCCEAAQEDLTEFFRAYGCFTPVDGAFIGDYTNSKYYTTQEEIDRAIAEVKAKKYPENFMPLFINDCTPDVTYRHDGKTPREYWDNHWNDNYPTPNGINAEVGCYVDYLAKNPITGEYKYDLNGLKVNISGGDGAVGFAVFNGKGEIQAFSNHHSFELNDSVFAHMVIYNDYKVYAIAPDGNRVEIPLTGKEEMSGTYQYSLSENKLMVSGGQNALAFGIYEGDKLVALLKGASYQATDEISRALVFGEMELRAHGINGSSVVVPAQPKDLSGDFIFTLKGNTVKVSGGKNALCYVVYDKDGVEQAYSGTAEFEVSDEIISLLADESSYVMAIGSGDSKVKVRLELESFFRAALNTAQSYVNCADETLAQMGAFYPDSVKSLAALIADAENVTTGYNKWIVALDSAVTALLENKGARIPVSPNSFYTINVAGRSLGYMGSVTAGLNHTTKGDKTDNVQWKVVPVGVGGNTYYLLNRETGNYLSVFEDGSRVKAASNDINNAVAVKFVSIADAPGQYFIQPASGATMNLYNKTSNQVFASSTESGSNAKWVLRLEDNMLKQPMVSDNGQITLYYMQCADDGKYAKYIPTGKSSTKGRISGSSDLAVETPEDVFNYWFYFTPGNVEGKYAIHSFASGMSFTIDSKNRIYANKESETTVDYGAALNEDGTGLVISAESGNLYMSSYIEISTEKSTPWKLQRAYTVGLAMDQQEATLMANSTLTLKAEVTSSPSTVLPVAWSSSDETVATVDENGNVTGVKEGDATITATVGVLKATCAVTVTPDTGVDAAIVGVNIKSQGSVIVVEGLVDGAEVSVYNVAGVLIGSVVADNGVATIDTKQSTGNTVIVKVGASSVKYSLK